MSTQITQAEFNTARTSEPTEADFLQLHELLNKFFESAAAGSQKSADRLCWFAYSATYFRDALENEPFLGENSISLGKRRVMVSDVFRESRYWPMMTRIKLDNATFNWLRFQLEIGIGILRLKFPDFDTFTIDNKRDELVEYLFPILLNAKPVEMKELAVSITAKRKKKLLATMDRQLARIKKKLANMPAGESMNGILEEEAIQLKAERDELSKSNLEPYHSEIIEAFKSDIKSRLKTMSHKVGGLK